MEDKLTAIRHKQSLNQIASLERSLVTALEQVVKFIDGKTTKTEVVNQLKEIGTPDALKVVKSVDALHNTFKNKKDVDLSEITRLLGSILSKVSEPTPEIKIPEAKDTVKVSNLKEIDFTTLEKAINRLQLSPEIKVESPEINIAKPDLEPLQKSLKSVVDAVKSITFPEVPKTDTTKLEESSDKTNKHLEEANKKLQRLIEQPKGGGGGGGNGTPYIDATGKPVNVEVESDGSIPVTVNASTPAKSSDQYGINAVSEDATYKYFWFEADNSDYYIMRKHKTTKVFTFTKGTGGYSSVYVDENSGPSGSPTWGSRGSTF